MRLHWSLLSLPLACLALAACDGAGKGLQGGQGDPFDYNVIPPVPSPPVVMGTSVVMILHKVNPPVNPTDPLHGVWLLTQQQFENDPDRYAAEGDTETVTLSPGPSTNTILVDREHLDDDSNYDQVNRAIRGRDELMLQDRGLRDGLGHWLGTGFDSNGNGYSLTLTTDAFGQPQQLIDVVVTQDATTGLNVTSKRYRDFGFAASTVTPGIYYCVVSTDGGPQSNIPPNVGNVVDVVVNSIGVWQFQQDVVDQHTYVAPGPPPIRAVGQFTTYNATRSENHNFYDDININPITLQPDQGDYQPFGRRETNNIDGSLFQEYSYWPGAGFIAPIGSPPRWGGQVTTLIDAPVGGNVWEAPPYQMGTKTQNPGLPPVVCSINGTVVTVWFKGDGTNALPPENFNIIRIEDGGNVPPIGITDKTDQMWAIHTFDQYNYDFLVLDRDSTDPSQLLGAAPVLTVTRYGRGQGSDQSLGAFQVSPVIPDP
jgi:hypothetical protein